VQKRDPNLIVGFEGAEDAGVYKLTDDIAIVQSVDYFPPIVDDPYDFGEIAAANALSDLYAMGAKPITAMNIVSFPKKKISIDILKKILKGGIKKVEEAGATLVGGHSIEDEELKYGLSVTGTIHPHNVIKNRGSKPGDLIILTKPIGTGIINTALKADLASKQTIEKVTESMKELNKKPSEIIQKIGVSAATDVTGFGLLGHLLEMIGCENIGMKIFTEKVPLFPDTKKFSQMGIVPAGTHSNRKSGETSIINSKNYEPFMLDILFDAQTSGGLVFTIKKEKAKEILAKMKSKGIEHASIIGEVISQPKGKIILE
jgi:selenide,water dikinase